MRYRKILVATDGSKQALKAAEQAAEVAKACGLADVEVLAVAVEYSPLKGRNPFMQAMQAEAEKAAEATAAVLAEHGVEAKTRVVLATGNAGEVICSAASETGADLIVMGSRGHGAAASLFAGSTSLHVVHCSKIPVLIVR